MNPEMEESNHLPLVSVVIPVKNGMDTLSACLNGIFGQSISERLEVIILDSASNDGTLEFLKQFPVRIIPVPPKEFNHGDTRNLGVREAKGEFVLLTVQDAEPADSQWIERMLEHFVDPEVAAVCGQQIVKADRSKNPLQWFRPQSEAEPFSYQFKNPEEFTRLSGKEQHAYCHWDDVNAMYRKSMKDTIPFRRLMFSEDTLWAKDALSAGYKIVYDYRARVYHYHHQNFKFYFKRSYIILYQNYKFYDYIKYPSNPITKKLQIIVRLLKFNELGMGEKLKWMKYNLILVLAAWLAALVFAFNARFRGIKGVESSQKYWVGYPPQGIQQNKK
jgi:rhamnosyltransferase